MATGVKTGGRVKGTPNRITAELRQRVSNFLSDNWEQFQKDFNSLQPKDRIVFYERLLQYGLPKLQSTELTSDIEKLDEDQIDYIINHLKNIK